ncbi:Hypothetical predicted protein [Cloeon dipterum]|uniref:Uncharacterized protein n=1 Tax=Cloeon dipterum TaxID=197152 RepID=A0A8S1C518_9INSE|nr:Hypothetical predicted protein [Cloeon dipterum]
MGRYSSDSDTSDSGRGSRKSRSSKSSHRTKGRSPSPESSSRHKSDSYSSRHKKKCKSRRSRSRERYSGSSRSRRGGGKHSRRSSSSSSSDARSRSKSLKRSPSTSSSSTTHSTKTPAVPVQDLASISASSNDLLSSTEQLRLKVQRAIQAASELKQRKAEEQLMSAPPVISQSSIDDINSDGFVQRSFMSAPRHVPDIPLPIVVDLTAEPKKDDSGIVSSVLLDDEPAREDRWARKLLALRQQARNAMFGDKLSLKT